MGLVKRDEGDAAAQIASTTTGVVRVVKLFEHDQLGVALARTGSDHAALPEPRYPAKIATAADALARIAALPRPLVSPTACSTCCIAATSRISSRRAALGASLVVAVNSDASVRRLGKGDDRPLNTLDDRMAVLAALACVDLVVPFDADTPRELIVACRPTYWSRAATTRRRRPPAPPKSSRGGGRFVAIPFALRTLDDRRSSTASAVDRTAAFARIRCRRLL